MWTCDKCGRIFKREKQQHSCKTIPFDQHFENKEIAKELFNNLLNQINNNVGKCKIISLPCCVHLFGSYDFLAALPYKDRLEIRFATENKFTNPRVFQSVPLSKHLIKVCIDIKNTHDIDTELIQWLKTSYYLKSI